VAIFFNSFSPTISLPKSPVLHTKTLTPRLLVPSIKCGLNFIFPCLIPSKAFSSTILFPSIGSLLLSRDSTTKSNRARSTSSANTDIIVVNPAL